MLGHVANSDQQAADEFFPGYADSPLDKLVHGICKVARACVGEVSQTQN